MLFHIAFVLSPGFSSTCYVLFLWTSLSNTLLEWRLPPCLPLTSFIFTPLYEPLVIPQFKNDTAGKSCGGQIRHLGLPAALELVVLSWCILHRSMGTVSSIDGSCHLTDTLLYPIYFSHKCRVKTQRGWKTGGLCWLSLWDQLRTCRASEDNVVGYWHMWA